MARWPWLMSSPTLWQVANGRRGGLSARSFCRALCYASAQHSVVELQDIGVVESGAYTGEIAGEMAQEVGAEWVIVGHSERRSDQQESDELIAQKLLAATRAKLRPILCVGETQASVKTAKQWPL